MPPFAGYTRVSRVGDRADRLISPELQQQRIQGYADARGLVVEMMEPELDVSGGKVERPILSKVIEGIEEGTYAGIIVAQYDRLSRMDITDALPVIRRIEHAGGEVIAVAENFDVGTPEGRMGRTVVLAMGEMQLGRYKAQFRAAKERAVREGIWPLPIVPIGYQKREDRRLEPSSLAPKVRKAFELRAAGAPRSVVADLLGIAVTTAAKVLRNRVYLGAINYAGNHNPAAHEPIVDPALFEAAQIASPRPPRGVNPPSLLQGIVRCAGCHRKMTPATERTGGRVYRCTPRNARGRCEAPAFISQRKLDPFVTDVFLHSLGDGQHSAARRDDRLQDATRALEAAEAELSSYQTITATAGLSAEFFMEGMRSRVEAVEAARADLARARAASGPLPAVGDLRELWEAMSLEERRHVLRSSLAVVWVKRGAGPAVDRARVIAAGFAPSIPLEPVPVDWPEGDLPGEVRPPGS